jgi:nucleotide-binding universal stress UspA family protein
MLDRPPTSTIRCMGAIVVATDGSPAAGAALEAAIRLARESGDRIYVITVWRALQGDYGLAYPPSAVLDDILASEREYAEATLRDAATRAQRGGVMVETRLATGDPSERICDYAAEVDARIVAIGSHGHSAPVSLLVGSVSGAVISRSSVPVLVAREGDREHGGARTRSAAAG